MSKSFTPPAFSKFGKTDLFQVYDKDAVEHNVKLVSKSVDGVDFESQIIAAPQKGTRGVIKTNFGLKGGIVVESTVQTDSSKASSVTLKKKNALKSVPGVTLSAALTSSEKDFSAKAKYGVFDTFTADYSRNNFTSSVGVTTDGDSQHSVSASAAVGFEGVSVGGDVKLVKTAGGAFEAKSYNAGLTYAYKNYVATAVSDSKFEKLKASIQAKQLGARAAYTLGAQVKLDLQAPKSGAPQREVIVSVEQTVSPNTTYRLAGVVNTRTLVGTVEQTFKNPKIKLSATAITAVPSGAYAAWPVSKYGVQVSLGDF